MPVEEETHSPLEYRPSFGRTPRERTAWEESFDDEDRYDSEPGSDIGSGVITDIIADYEDTKERLENTIREKEKALRHITLPVSDAELPYVKEAKAELGLPEGPLSFQDYTDALARTDTPAGDYLVELVERAAEDIDGDIRIETYADYIELKQEFDVMDTYIERFIYPVFNFKKDDPDDWFRAFGDSELDWQDKQNKRHEEYNEAKAAYKHSYLHQRSSLMQARSQLHNKEKTEDLARHEYQTLKNSAIVVAQKTGAVNWLLDDLDELNSHEPDLLAAADELLTLAESDQEAIAALADVNLYLKLAVDEHNKDKHAQKHVLRDVYGVQKQQKILDEYALHSKAFQSKGLNVTHYMRAFQHQLAPESEALMNEMARGLAANAKQVTDKAYEFYSLQRACSSLREDKITNVRQKHLARLGYRAFQDRIRQIQLGEE